MNKFLLGIISSFLWCNWLTCSDLLMCDQSQKVIELIAQRSKKNRIEYNTLRFDELCCISEKQVQFQNKKQQLREKDYEYIRLHACYGKIASVKEKYRAIHRALPKEFDVLALQRARVDVAAIKLASI